MSWSYLTPLGALVESGEELVNGRRVHLNQRLTCINISQVEISGTGRLNINEGFFFGFGPDDRTTQKKPVWTRLHVITRKSPKTDLNQYVPWMEGGEGYLRPFTIHPVFFKMKIRAKFQN